jgi:hypothetical protein
MRIETIKLVLTIIGGLCWTLVYIEGIRIGLRDRTYAIPFCAVALNLAWELVHTVFGFQRGADVQTIINVVWLVFDLGILYTYFQFGKKYFPAVLSSWFIAWSILIMTMAFWVEYAFVKEFDSPIGGHYAAFIQNLLMSVLFIHMLESRGSREGQSIFLAVNKWIGTLAPTIVYGILRGGGDFREPSFLILILGTFCCVFDVVYILLLMNTPANTAITGRKRKHA